MTADPILQELTQRLIPVYKPLRIYLFGSRTQSVARPDSDYDLLIIVADNAPKELKSAGKAYEALWGIAVPVDIVVWTLSEFEKRLHIKSSLPAQVIQEGKLLHVA